MTTRIPRTGRLLVLGAAALALSACIPPQPTGDRVADEGDAQPVPVAKPTREPVHPTPPPLVVPEPQLAATRGPRLAAVQGEPQLRIRIKTGLATAQIGAGRVLVSVTPEGPPTSFDGPLILTRSGEGFMLADPAGRRWTWASPRLCARAETGDLTINKQAYPGEIELSAQGKTSFDLVNDVPLERYLPGVLAKELYKDWQPEAYRAQAVAARSYAIWEMTLRRAQGRPFDLESDESSQAYLGTTTNAKAVQAVRQTRGTVLAFEGRVLPAFFSACSGGAAQDAFFAFPGRVDDLAPLRGRPLSDAASLCKNWRWPALTRDKADAVRRLAAWGAAEKNPVAQLRSLAAARVSAVSPRGGRPVLFELTDDAGQTYTVNCEDFRLALNGGAPAVDPKSRLLSSFCSVRVAGDTLVFENGRGHGHGVGMEQWGAEGMARQGAPAEKILATYYPGATLEKAY